ncbi:hypothetical protein ALC56_09201 [Trachymyrmex septentrionalis]|uniref:Uncharacterized protein n=1 Tax=Trachymyrmex septentrionalis TaxID=34720 RepID=A0A195F780_9HYME|nr:hypothetical protein ALC56_09201 [Trachymyrmex septentrionalis]
MEESERNGRTMCEGKDERSGEPRERRHPRAHFRFGAVEGDEKGGPCNPRVSIPPSLFPSTATVQQLPVARNGGCYAESGVGGRPARTKPIPVGAPYPPHGTVTTPTHSTIMMAIRPSERISGNSLAFLSAAGVAAAAADATNTDRPVVLVLVAAVPAPPSLPSLPVVLLAIPLSASSRFLPRPIRPIRPDRDISKPFAFQ